MLSLLCRRENRGSKRLGGVPEATWLESYSSESDCFPTPHTTVSHMLRGVKLIFTGGHISLVVTFKGPTA